MEEIDETAHWLELVAEAGYVNATQLTPLRNEATELLAIFSRMAKTTRIKLAGTKRKSKTSITGDGTVRETSPPHHVTTSPSNRLTT